jgi:hypothetical protein
MFRSDGLVIRDIESQRCFGDSPRFQCNHWSLSPTRRIREPANSGRSWPKSLISTPRHMSESLVPANRTCRPKGLRYKSRTLYAT